MAAADKADIVRDLFAAYMANDRKAVEDSFTEDFRFTSPYDDEIDKATYFERCWKVSDWIAAAESRKDFRRRRWCLRDLSVRCERREEFSQHRVLHFRWR